MMLAMFRQRFLRLLTIQGGLMNRIRTALFQHLQVNHGADAPLMAAQTLVVAGLALESNFATA
jgi:hypothetical protein